MNALVDALRRAVQAEISAAIAMRSEDAEGRPRSWFAEHKEVERSWAIVARVAEGLDQERDTR